MIQFLLDFIKKLHCDYGSKLEQYIIERNPQNSFDVERLTYEFHEKQIRQ